MGGAGGEGMNNARLESGYCDCACRDCFDIAIRSEGEADALCWECEEAGCEAHNGECQRSDAYGCEDEEEPEPDTVRYVKERGIACVVEI
jgi:hypothetical protein